MTVAELIAKLQKFPLEKEIDVWDDKTYHFSIASVEYDEPETDTDGLKYGDKVDIWLKCLGEDDLGVCEECGRAL